MIKKLLNSGIFWTIIIGFFGIGLTILFYEYSNKEREPVYALKKEPSLIFDKENSTPKIKLLSNDSLVVNDNVYVSNIVIWNDGDLEIRKTDVRKKFKVFLSSEAKILDYKIVNQTNPEISNFRIKSDNNELLINWDYFDPKFGFELQIIYSGTSKSEVFAEGYVLGKKLKKVTTRESNNLINYYYIFSCFTLIVSGLIFYKEYKETPTKIRLAMLIMIVLVISAMCFLMIKITFTEYTLPL
ncbi:hypothetical protein [uncultured Kordia sp.]|uniref:hypothetical protein n=1 Tax=uncultured Kordia sp. TaxID=507699 RepID=UPI0026260AEF|nr:hypothetical protein [uncultured Kordia sp.]